MLARGLLYQAHNNSDGSFTLKNFSRLAIAAAFAVSTGAFADTVTLTYDNPIYAHGSDGVVLAGNPPGPPTSYPYTSVGAGEFGATVNSYTGGLTSANFVDSQSDFFLYCYDLFQTISAGGQFTYTVNYTAAQSRTLDFLGAVNYVLNGNTNAWSDPFAWLHPANAGVSAAIQLGIWDSLYDTDSDFSLATGSFQASGLDAGTTSEYALFQAAVQNASVNDVPLSQTMVLQSADHQDQITGYRPPRRDLPEPGSLALLAAGLIAAGVARRARKG